jgi:ArsR family transcriptional regulator, arsenate/arsenite/antimonite-responsive transcriptional repressor
MLNNTLDAANVTRLGQAAKALGHPKRIAILNALMQGVQCNCEIAAQLGIADNLISHHMRILEETGLVQSERDPDDARWIYYSIDPQALAQIQAALTGFFDPARVRPRQPQCGPGGCAPCR